MKPYKNLLTIYLILLSCAINASDRNPLRTEITGISIGSDHSEYYAVKIFDPLSNDTSKPSFTALFFKPYTSCPSLLLPPCDLDLKTEEYLTAVINTLPIIQQKSAHKVFKTTRLSVQPSNEILLASLIGITAYKKNRNYNSVTFIIKSKNFPVRAHREEETINFLFEIPKKIPKQK